MNEGPLDRLSRFLVEVEDLAKLHNISMFDAIPEKDESNSWHVIIRFTAYSAIRESPPPLGIRVTDGISGKDKPGG